MGQRTSRNSRSLPRAMLGLGWVLNLACDDQEGGRAMPTGPSADARAEIPWPTVDAATCAPKTCAQLGAACGVVPDGCTSVVECGGCPAGLVCGGDGPNLCGTVGCTPTTCLKAGASCGLLSDGCAAVLDCGSCSALESCGGGGVPNTCGSSGGHGGTGGGSQSTTCDLEIKPDEGFEDTVFMWTGQSNGTACTWSLDSVSQGECSCSGSGTFLGSDVGLGETEATLHVTQGPSGPESCSASVFVRERTWCTHDISPSTGTSSTAFSWVAASNGTACDWSLDDTPMGSCDCSWDWVFLGSDVGPGHHTAVLFIRDGPSGPVSCAASVFVQ